MTDSRPEFGFTVQARDGRARRGVLQTAWGQWIHLFLCQWVLLPLSRR